MKCNLNHINEFYECLKFSHKAEDLPFWNEVYQKTFPNMIAILNHRQDGWHQRAGIDRSIILSNSKQILIDEKVRGRNKKTGKVYTDIALEYVGNDKRNTPGWVCKSLKCDYIAYAIAPIGKCYLLPVIQLQTVWDKNKEEWLKSYFTIKAPNLGYSTLSCCLPPAVLFKAIGQELRVNFEPIEIST